MACFVSFSISVPLCSLQIPLKDRYPRKSGLCRLPGLPTTKTGSCRLGTESDIFNLWLTVNEHPIFLPLGAQTKAYFLSVVNIIRLYCQSILMKLFHVVCM
ncbi:PREDICTED: uncharacterized protein LOC18600448 isoform X2 [Theobroma cacao]|uniref:Uncharacterized protein LOC18600448 isoform X2 n=1 Tax=Theobroma cacao TaxID=3641 RepID=A0AB32WD75_THECC|nr:PREDICTED: uncharacterized protein LOC18600448 isoform X2 [Theobroma cacao]